MGFRLSTRKFVLRFFELPKKKVFQQITRVFCLLVTRFLGFMSLHAQTHLLRIFFVLTVEIYGLRKGYKYVVFAVAKYIVFLKAYTQL